MMTSPEVILNVIDLKMYFPVRKGVFRRQVGNVKAVDGVSFDVYRGETLGLVGESGCGKTTTGRAIVRIYRPTGGKTIFHGLDLARLRQSQMLPIRRKIQMIFQDPYASLNPRLSVQQIVGEPLQIHRVLSGKELKERVSELLGLVGLNPGVMNRFPHEFSGGQRQRIGLARSLALNPDLIICDEPVSALDVSIQAQVINLLIELQQELGLTYIFIAHDLNVVRHISKRVAVMYLGKIVELADRETLYKKPLHPYTQALLSAIPVANPTIEKKRQRIILEGDLPNPANPPNGCNFNTRCPYAKETCFDLEPEYLEGEPGHFCACHLMSR